MKIKKIATVVLLATCVSVWLAVPVGAAKAPAKPVVQTPVKPVVKASTTTTKRTLTVTGTGVVVGKPDQAVITLGAQSMGSTAKEAQLQNAELLTNIVDAMIKAGVKQENIQTSNFSLNPDINYGPSPEGGAPTISGYRVSNNVTVITKDPANVGQLIDVGIEAGVNQVWGVDFALSEPDALNDQATVAALANAKTRAVTILQGTGLKVKRIIQITEQGGYDYSNRSAMMDAAMGAGDSTQILPGNLRITRSLQVVFEIGK